MNEPVFFYIGCNPLLLESMQRSLFPLLTNPFFFLFFNRSGTSTNFVVTGRISKTEKAAVADGSNRVIAKRLSRAYTLLDQSRICDNKKWQNAKAWKGN